MLKGLIHIHESFFEPMTEEEIREIEERCIQATRCDCR